MNPPKKVALIIGAGPAGLTVAYELATRTEYQPIIVEQDSQVGGLSKSIAFDGNKVDIGPHRFFSKSDRVMDWWLERLPLENTSQELVQVSYRGKVRQLHNKARKANRETAEDIMLVVNRKTRIYYNNKLYDYPIKLNLTTISNLGWLRTIKIGVSYLKAKLNQRDPEKSLEDFIINRFGQELYQTFFENYTEKVWGIHPSKIDAEWGKQRIKGLSLTKVIVHFVKSLFGSPTKTETSLVGQFLYPKYGAGHMWDVVAKQVKTDGGEIILNSRASKITVKNKQVVSVVVENLKTGDKKTYKPDLVFSTMPIKYLVRNITGTLVPEKVKQVAAGLLYRDMINVAVVLKKLTLSDVGQKTLQDNWLYIQDSRAQVGRVEIVNNMSPFIVHKSKQILIGAEYFCNATDPMWLWSDRKMSDFVVKDLSKIGLINPKDVLKVKIMRIPKTYPAYFGSYDRFDEVKSWLDKIENLYLLGRNGMHKYNNQDHSMLTAMVAVDAIVAGEKSKESIWAVNTEDEYHETKSD